MPNGSKRSTIAVSFLTLYIHHPLDSRQISSGTTEHSDTRARLNLIKPDKFSNFGRAASILIRAMNINGRQLRHNSITFSNILALLVSFFFSLNQKSNLLDHANSSPEFSFLFVSFLTRGFLFFASSRRTKIRSKLYFSFLSLPPFLSLPLSNSLIFDRMSFETRLSIPAIESVRHADSIRSKSIGSKQNPWTQRSRMCCATISINKARGSARVIPPLPSARF